MRLKLSLLLIPTLLCFNISFSQNRINKKFQKTNQKIVKSQTQKSNDLPNQLLLMSPSDKAIIDLKEVRFTWESSFKDKEKSKYELTILSVNSQLSLEENIKANAVYHKANIERKNEYNFRDIKRNQSYIWSVKVINKDKTIRSSWWTFFPTDLELIEMANCDNNPISNSSFENGREGWDIKKGRPNFIKDDKGCNNPAYVELKGNKVNYDLISQNLSTPFQNQRHYKIKFCLRNPIKSGKAPKLKILAFNGSNPNINLNAQTALIYSSGEVPYLNDWSEFETPAWTATNSFTNIGFYVTNDTNEKISKLLIDNVCIIEVDENNCEEEIAINLDKNGNYTIVDARTNSIIDSKQSKILETNHNFKRGNIDDLYGGSTDTSVDDFYEDIDFSSPCYSIGDYDPTKDFEKIDEEVDSTQFRSIMNKIKKKADTVLNETFLPEELPKVIDVGLPNNDKQCNAYDPNLPFGGADIIYVHGLATAHLMEALSPNQIHKKFKAEWPSDKNEFYKGDYKQYADDYWKDHIKSKITDNNGNLTNRYMTVAYPCDQRLGDGIHAVLTQISDAIRTGVGVKYNKSDPRKDNCFGNKIVIVSHSTGGLLVSSMLGIAELSKTDQDLQNAFGINLHHITNRVQVHIALNPALSGSKLATLAVVAPKLLGKIVGASNPLAALAAEAALSKYNDVVDNSVLIDLMPPVSQYYWGKTYYANAKVSTITLAGSTPGLPQGGAMAWAGKFFIKGYNDGVVSMDSQCGSNQEWFIPSNYLIGNPLRMIDFGNPFTTKALGLGYDSRFNRIIPLSPVRISACTPYVTPAGMVTPYKRGLSGILRWKNHYSMIQSTMTHFDATGDILRFHPNYNPSVVSNISNYEEVRVITDDYLYTSGLVSNNFKNMVNEHVRKKTIGFHFPAFRRKRGFPFFEIYWKYHEITIWKRTYHLLQDYETKNGVDYMYDHILR